MSTTYQAKLIYGIDARLAKFHSADDKNKLVNDYSINNVEYFYEQSIFGELIAEVEEDDLVAISPDIFKGISPDKTVFSCTEFFKLYLIVDSY